jgi:hypothetical protein
VVKKVSFCLRLVARVCRAWRWKGSVWIKKLAQPEVSIKRLLGMGMHFLVERLADVVIVVVGDVGEVAGDATC